MVTEWGMLKASLSATNSSSVEALSFSLSTANPTDWALDTPLASPCPLPVEGADSLFLLDFLLGPDFLYGTEARGSMSSPVCTPCTIVSNSMWLRTSSVPEEQERLLLVLLESDSTASTDMLSDSPEKAFPLLTLRLSESDICTSKLAFLTELTLLRLCYAT
jgi:hypothetical protein